MHHWKTSGSGNIKGLAKWEKAKPGLNGRVRNELVNSLHGSTFCYFHQGIKILESNERKHWK